MDLTSVKNIKNLLKLRQVKPSKGLGQNFLVDKGVLRDIITAADLRPDDIVLEIGPGLGVLTQELAKAAKKVIAIEKDPKMVEILGGTLKDFKNIEIIHGDIRYLGCPTSPKIWGDVGHQDIGRPKYKVVANLPYYIVSPVIRYFLENTGVQPLQMVLMAQKEVAQRICSKPPDMNLLAVSVQFYAEPKIISYVSKKSFWPQPKVDSAIIKITPKPPLMGDKDLFFKIVKAGFSQPRKQLANNLSHDLKLDRQKTENWLLQNNIQPAQRAETLSLEDWMALLKNFQSCSLISSINKLN